MRPPLKPEIVRRVLIHRGEPMAVIRPRDPDAATARVEAIMADQSIQGHKVTQAAFDAMLSEQEYMFVGLAQHGSRIIIDLEGNDVGEVQPGDSFVAYADLTPQNWEVVKSTK